VAVRAAIAGQERVAVSSAAAKLKGLANANRVAPKSHMKSTYLNMVEIPHVETYVPEASNA